MKRFFYIYKMKQNTFLEDLTNQIIADNLNTLENIVIVLPNKRAKIFLIETLKHKITTTIFAPSIISIEDFIQEVAEIDAIDPIELLFEFYKVYLSITPSKLQESFEQFSNWAITVLQDFNEIDRYLIEPNYVFSYLEEIEVIKRWELEAKDKTKLIDNYLLFWKQLPVYYYELYKYLLTKKKGYQGLIYREADKNKEKFAKANINTEIIFAGFNALNKSEEKIIQYLLENNQAKIYWDIDSRFLKDYAHDAGLFIRKFKNEWAYYKKNDLTFVSSHFSKEKNIQIIGTSKSIGQAKIVSNIINENRKLNSTETLDKVAIVLGDENLLIPILHTLPENVGSLNITMGYSAMNNPVQQLISKLFKLHINASNRSKTNYIYYYKDLLAVLNNPIIESAINTTDLIQLINENNYTFITQQKIEDFQRDKNRLFGLIFKKWDRKPEEILQIILDILLIVKSKINKDEQTDKVLNTFLYSIYKIINKLMSYTISHNYLTSLNSIHEIYKKLIETAEVSFEGEPLSGLQIMGVLESRALNFETVIITSMNEGRFPAGKTNNSFIPFDVKLELKLPTYKEKDAIYAYHFYHLLQRAKNIYLIYNTENDGLDGGEKSRFITQLEVEKMQNHNLSHVIMQPIVPNIASQPMVIKKSKLVMDRLKEIATIRGFSPSAITSYIRNPIQFYFQKILSIKETDQVEEDIALNTLGTIIHKTLEELYKPYIEQYLDIKKIDKMLVDSEAIVLQQFQLIYKEGVIKKGKNLLAFEVAKQNVKNFLKEEIKSLQDNDTIKILALETTLERIINSKELPFPIKISGNVDRIELRNGTIRIIDYKTGRVEKNNVILSDWNGIMKDSKKDKIIQLLSYAYMYEETAKELPMEAGIISFKNMKSGFLAFGIKEEKINNTQIKKETLKEFEGQLIELLKDILDQNNDFIETI